MKIRLVELLSETQLIWMDHLENHHNQSRYFKKYFKKLILMFVLWDERLSTVGAFNLSSQLDINVSKREKK